MRRGIEPRYGFWTYPGGYMEIDESVEECAVRAAEGACERCRRGIRLAPAVEAAHEEDRADLGISETGADAGLHARCVGVPGYNGRKGGVVAVIEKLEELLIRPWGAALGAKVVEDEQVDVLDPLEQLVE